MWLVRFALRRPYSIAIAAVLTMLLAIGVVRRAPTDIFPEVDIPVISVVWIYPGLPTLQMEQQMTQTSEFSLSGNVGGIRKIESQTLDGLSVIKLYLHEGTDVASATAQVTAASQNILKKMPPGAQPPIIVRYNASSVPILQLSFHSETMTEAEVYDYVSRTVRSQISSIRGTLMAQPSGGRIRQMVVDIDPGQLRAYGLSPNDVSQAVASQNLTLPTGSAKIGETEYRVSLNNSPESIRALNDVPLRARDGRTLFLRDVAFVHDGYQVQTNLARQDGKRAVVLSVIKTGGVSTTEIAAQVREMLGTLRAAAPPGLRIELLADQSIFVRSAIRGLIREGIIAATLTGILMLAFLGSWRSTAVVLVSIPLSVMVALLAIRALGYTINTMTLGGMALAVGILVDDATVELENIHRNLAMGKTLTRAILDGASQIAIPAFVTSVAISLVFSSVVFLEGPARYLFMPLGISVVVAVMASYFLSRTLVPTLVRHLLPAELAAHARPPPGSLSSRARASFERAFDAVRDGYAGLLQVALRHRAVAAGALGVIALLAGFLARFVGRDFFPAIDAGQIRLHVTAPPGTRLEETEKYFAHVEGAVREIIPKSELDLILDQVGVPQGYNLALMDSANVSVSDGEMLIRLTSAHRLTSSAEYVERLRRGLAERFPELGFYFQPADIVSQILNFGLPSPVVITASGANREAGWTAVEALAHELRTVPGVVDVRIHQVPNAPRLHVDIDRVRASMVGLTQHDVASDSLLSASTSAQVAPNFFADPMTGTSYAVVVQVPDFRLDSLEALRGITVASPHGLQMLDDIVSIQRRSTPIFTSRVDVLPAFEVRADIQHSDLGEAAARIAPIVEKQRRALPPGSTLAVGGQIESMRASFTGLGLGILLALLLVYAVLAANFESWRDPFLVLLAIPGAAAGIVVALYTTGTTLSIPSMMGAVMSVGLATANSTLLVSFANDLRADGLSAFEAALRAGTTRLRPVVMTTLAMIAGMLPMALGVEEGGEQNAALARSAIGGLTGATFATLFLVPMAYTALRRRPPQRVVDPDLDALDEAVTAVRRRHLPMTPQLAPVR